jgi:hypothetical protein
MGNEGGGEPRHLQSAPDKCNDIDASITQTNTFVYVVVVVLSKGCA